DDEEKQKALETEIVTFEEWAARVRSDVNNPEFSPGYDHLRKAVRILGIKVIVYPTKGDYPYRYTIDATVPEVLKKMDCTMYDGRASTRIACTWKSLNGPVPKCSATRQRCAARGMAAVSVDGQKLP